METANHEYYVPLEVAKLLKEAGFKWFINSAYRDGVLMHQGNLLCDNFNGKQYENAARHEFFSAPTLEVAQRWLREVKDIYTMVSKDFTTIDGWHYFVVKKEDWESGNESNFYQQESNNHTYEEAQEAGIKKALEIILEKGE